MRVSSDDGAVRAPTARTVTIALPLPPRELWPNWSGKLRDRIRAKREAREWAGYAAVQAVAGRGELNLPWARVRATAAYTFPLRRTRDDDALVAALKNYRDGIADVLCERGRDDHWTWEGMPSVSIGPGEGVVITVRAVREGETQ